MFQKIRTLRKNLSHLPEILNRFSGQFTDHLCQYHAINAETDRRLLSIEAQLYEIECFNKDLLAVKTELKRLSSKIKPEKKIETKPLIIKKAKEVK